MRPWPLLVAAAVLLAGCTADPAVGPSPMAEDSTPLAPLVAEAGVPVTVASSRLTGDVALEVSFAESGGSCTTEMRASRRSADTGPTMMLVLEDGSWIYNAGTTPRAGAAGMNPDVAPERDGDFGFRPRTFETPHTMRYWAHDVAETSNSRTYGAAFWVGFVCDRPTEYTLRGAREAFLVSGDAFAPMVGATVPIAASAIVDARYTVETSAPLLWMHLLPAGSWNLTATRVDQPLEVGEPGTLHTFPAGPVQFNLDGAGTAGDVVLVGAAFQAIRTAEDLESLPRP